MSGWAKIIPAAKYAGVSPRTFRDWLKDGLKHSRLKSGTVLIRLSDIDSYLEGFAVSESAVDKIVSEFLKTRY